MNSFLILKKHSSVLVAILFLNFFSKAQITVIGSNSKDGTYASLSKSSGAFAALNSLTQAGKTITITITADITTEDGANALTGASGMWTSLLIQPNGARTVSGSAAKPLIDLNGADNVTIDGLNSGGNSLVISNSSTSSTSGTSTIRLVNDATYNSIRNCTITGSGTTSGLSNYGGVVFFSTTSTTTGNSNNTISYCNIGPAGSNLPSRGIYSRGSSDTKQNKNNTIDHCNIYDIFINSTCAGITIFDYNSDWIISNNKIYQTATRNADYPVYGIYIYNYLATPGNNFQIYSNTIGYASSSGTGVYTINATTATTSYIIGISIEAGTGTASSIKGNIISDINNPSSVKHTRFIGIECVEGKINVGSITGTAGGGNVIKNISGNIYEGYGVLSTSTITTNNIEYTYIHDMSSNYPDSYSSPTLWGIYQSAGNVKKNNIFNLTATWAGYSSYPFSFYGIYNEGVSGAGNEISNNMISLSGGSAANVYLCGFYDQGSGGSYNFYHNSIFITGSSANSSESTYAFYRNSTNTFVIKNNILANSKASGGSGKNYDIYLNNTGSVTSDYNTFYSSQSGTNYIGNYGGSATGANKQTLANWKSAFSGEANSTVALPNFTSNSDLHLTSNNVGWAPPVGSITTDIDDDGRNATYPTIGADENIIGLPIKLLWFTAKLTGEIAEVLWTTASEKNNDYFIVEKSPDGIHFETLEKIKGHTNQSKTTNYQTYDLHPYQETTYYRLKQIDTDGSFSFSDIVSVNRELISKVFSYQVYPNPNDGSQIRLLFEQLQDDILTIDLYNTAGELIISDKWVRQNEEQSYALPLSEKLSSGIYIIKVSSTQTVLTKKLIIN